MKGEGASERVGGGSKGSLDSEASRAAYLPDLQFDPLPLYFYSSDLEINSWGGGCEAR